ncbi:hypothetical protein INT48_004309 [Thamnidium elegans]|uniref:BHLH domain-containing protein n=1 Tax=Thamnidium elegans TaxID=101142 RepID=A0A8H7SSA1_9FUNG|nr:hypothetical protein INT48_004309 [Thamnidium elegans]
MPPVSTKKRKITTDVPVKISVAPAPQLQPTTVALPPPLVPYHPHLVPSYYHPVYHQHPYFLQVGPQPPISPSLSPTLTSATTTQNNENTTTTTTTTTATSQRILPKSPAPTQASLAPTYNYFPYPIQVSPQLHPTVQSPSHHQQQQQQQQQLPGSVSPLPFQPIGATPRTNSVSSTITTADQREQARKVSHSAIERRRRERINDKIIQLKELIPACQDRENLHKMTILQSAIEYITYLKKVIEDVDHIEPKENNNTTPTQTKSMLPKEVEPFTHQFSVAHNKLNPPSIITTQEEEEDTWSVSSSPRATVISPVTPLPTGLKPMDLIKLNRRSSPPPRIIVHEHHSDDSTSSIDRNMNLENILC